MGAEVGCILRFVHDLVPGFDVVTLGKGGNSFRFGTVIGDYEFHHEDEKTAATEELFHALKPNLTIWKIPDSKGFGTNLDEAL